MSNVPAKKEPFNLSKIVTDLDIKINIQSFNQLLNTDPKQEWIKKHPVDSKILYIPVDRVKLMLFQIFQGYNWSIKSTSIMANSVVIYGTLTVEHPITGKQWSVDGIGAVPIELEKEAHPTDFTKIKSKSLHKNVPAAESFALKNAAAKFGALFGGGLNTSNEDFTLKEIYKADIVYATDKQRSYIETLINNSTYSGDEQRIMIEKCYASDLTNDEASVMITSLELNQLHPITEKGIYNETDIKKQIKKIAP